jgi:hypothetical protein
MRSELVFGPCHKFHIVFYSSGSPPRRTTHTASGD